VAKIIAKKSGKPTYVGCSVALGDSSIEEEMAGMKTAVETILKVLQEEGQDSG